MPLSATLAPAELDAEPGTTAAFTLDVEGEGAVRFEVSGPPADWALVVPPEVTVPAEGRAQARVVVNVPRSPHIAPGPCTVTVAAVGAGARAEAEGVVRIQPFADVRAGLSPRVSKGRKGAAQTLHVENQGNEAVRARVEAEDCDRGLVVALERTEVALAPGEVAAVPLRVRARGRRIVGGERSRSFTIAVRTGPGAEPSVTAEGIFVQERQRWPLPLALAVVLAGGFAALARGGDAGEDRAAPPMPPPAPAAVVAAAATQGATAACPASPSGPPDLLVQNFLFCPGEVRVTRGSELRWINHDGAVHTVSADGDVFDTGNFGRGEARTVRFDQAGTFAYFCRLHPFMRGSVVVAT